MGGLLRKPKIKRDFSFEHKYVNFPFESAYFSPLRSGYQEQNF